MFPVTPEQLAQARELDLLTYLRRYEPDELIPHGNGSYATRTHSSLKLSNGKWYWWSRGVGGVTALDYLVEVRGLSLPDAVRHILGAGPMPPAALVPPERRRPQPLRLPPHRRPAGDGLPDRPRHRCRDTPRLHPKQPAL